MSNGKSIIIAGAGIGGVTAAILLVQAGHDVRVFEQAPALGEVGAGIQISANGSRVLHSLGLGDQLEKLAVKPQRYVFRLFSSGEILQDFGLAEDHQARHGFPYYQIHRADLHAALVDRLRELAPDAIVLGCAVKGFEESVNSVTVKLEGGDEAEADLLIGADGVKSTVRRAILGETPAHFTGQSVWRIMVPTSILPESFAESAVSIWVGPGKHGVVYKLRGGELTNFVGCVDSPNWTDDSWTVRCDWNELKNDFSGGWHQDIVDLIEVADKNECYRWAMYNRPPVDRWSTARATLLGDACHATLPYLAQGAVMAIEDAAVLTRSLEEASSDIAAALGLYQRNRIARTARVVTESSDNARLFHLPSETALRQAFSERNIGEERNTWLYNYDPLTVPLQ